MAEKRSLLSQKAFVRCGKVHWIMAIAKNSIIKYEFNLQSRETSSNKALSLA